jgi:hypothetical protein
MLRRIMNVFVCFPRCVAIFAAFIFDDYEARKNVFQTLFLLLF